MVAPHAPFPDFSFSQFLGKMHGAFIWKTNKLPACKCRWIPASWLTERREKAGGCSFYTENWLKSLLSLVKIFMITTACEVKFRPRIQASRVSRFRLGRNVSWDMFGQKWAPPQQEVNTQTKNREFTEENYGWVFRKSEKFLNLQESSA